MDDVRLENKFINKIDTGFPAYLDWESLRTQGLDYLGKLSGKIWTDHNVHDPGITTLEVLCYALMDLGYRVNLPVEDILARKPGDNSPDNNFFSASQILACNPLTITDFRKLLIDIDGVRNAWLIDAYYEQSNQEYVRETSCSGHYNGLYKVYIETERDYDLSSATDKNDYEDLLNKIRDILMAHRNLCEDFIDIYILCKQPIGLCMDIELEVDAEPEQVYRDIVDSVRAFFSPAPKFYTLKQLFEEKNKGIEEIFAGRPYNIKESHGFVDTEELEQIHLKKSIHLSDVFHVILGVKGVRNVNDLSWRENCGSTPVVHKRWIWAVPENHIPDFSIDCSVVKFSRRSLPVAVDIKQLNELYGIDFNHTGKVPYKVPSPYLDLEMPGGFYRNDLGDYQSIQHDFPRVYGIKQGGLSTNVSDRRKAQAYQLKAYLLFFDQLLANYLAQLQNLRSLFALNSPADKKNRHSFFINQLTDVPEMEKLLRFGGSELENVLGNEGSTVAVAVKKQPLLDAINDGSVRKKNLHEILVPYSFHSKHSCHVAISNTQQEMLYADYNANTYSTSDNCWFFYFTTTEEDIALVSREFYPSEKKARQAADSTKFIGAYRENYHSFIDKDNCYTFFLEFTISNYGDYLQRMIEDEYLYNQRRQEFLNHLLSRFSERFTDYALLSFGFVKEKQLAENDIQQKEKFLAAYPDLSSNRGRSYNYWLDGWNNDNLSGFEKRTIALAGMGEMKRHFLCHFVVEEYEEYYVISIRTRANEVLFASTERFYSKEVAAQSAKELMLALEDENNYTIVEDKSDGSTRIRARYHTDKNVFYDEHFANGADAEPVLHGLQKLFSRQPSDRDVSVSRRVYKFLITNITDEKKRISVSKQFFDSPSAASGHAAQISQQVTDESKWEPLQDPPFKFEEIHLLKNDDGPISFINLKGFKYNADDDVVGKKGKWKYELLDIDNQFKFISTDTYDTKNLAEDACRELLILLCTTPDLTAEARRHGDLCELRIMFEDQLVAHTDDEYSSEIDALDAWKRIRQILSDNQFALRIEEVDYRWTFAFLLGYKAKQQWRFLCTGSFHSPGSALEKAKQFYAATETLELRTRGKTITVTAKTEHETITCSCNETTNGGGAAITGLLSFKKEVFSALDSTDTETFERFITNDVADINLKFIYRLVDKDTTHAVYTGGFDRTDFNSAAQKKKELFQNLIPYQYTDIKLSGDMIRERKDATRNMKWYHYQVRCRISDTEDLIMFESVKGYRSREEAQKAFDENYLLILHKATDRVNYGTDRFISLEQLLQHSAPDCDNSKTVVFVPDETKEYFNWYPAIIITALRRIAKQYPVRYVTKEEDIFYQLFPCVPDERTKAEKEACPKKTDGTKYFYYVLLDDKGSQVWQSAGWFSSHDGAMQRFHFFLILLQYPGNYTVREDHCYTPGDIDDKDCVWQIIIREVLVESKQRFARRPQVWDAIEEFICVSQSKDSFQAYINEKNCRFTFQVSCNNAGLIHPCKYESETARDAAIKKLLSAASNLPPAKFPQVVHDEKNKWNLLNAESKAVATIVNEEDEFQTGKALPYQCVADLFAEIFSNLAKYNDKNPVAIPVIDAKTNSKAVRTIKPADTNIEFAAWKQLLWNTVYEYPVVKRDDGRYEVVIRFLGIGCDDIPPSSPCTDAIERMKYSPPAITWQSSCCFETCENAWDFYREVKECLQQPTHYLATFDCECGPYGIKLNCDCRHLRQKPDAQTEDPAVANNAETIVNPNLITPKASRLDCCSETIAFNPQRYTTPKMDCDAVERAKRLINCEGLHTVEHLLLRPRCEQDCECLLAVCDTKPINCGDLQWKPTNEEDKCDPKTNPIEFHPGEDPYSFIATVALPAWPERFRKTENRLLLENLLYREAPAHILLRILWLKPFDFCRFETMFKNWSRWGVRRVDGCANESLCDFRDFLFGTTFECLEDCEICQPCKKPGEEPDPCFARQDADPCGNRNRFQNNINELYCWNEIECAEDDSISIADIQKPLAFALTADIPTTTPMVSVADSTVVGAEPIELTAVPSPRKVKLELQGVPFKSRLGTYKKVADELETETGENRLATEVRHFLDGAASSKATTILLTELLRNRALEKKDPERLKPTHNNQLVKLIVFNFLDKKAMTEHPLNEVTKLKHVFDELLDAGIDMDALYTEWHYEEVKKGKANVPFTKIKQSLTKRKKS